MGCGASKAPVIVENPPVHAQEEPEPIDFPPQKVEIPPKRYGSEPNIGFMFVKPGFDAYWSQIITRILDLDLEITDIRVVQFDKDKITALVANSGPDSHHEEYYMTDICLAIKVFGSDAHAKLVDLAGPTDPSQARENPLTASSLRGLYGKGRVRNAVHVSASVEDAVYESEVLMPPFYRRLRLANGNTNGSSNDYGFVLFRPHMHHALATFLSQTYAFGLDVSNLLSFSLSEDYLKHLFARELTSPTRDAQFKWTSEEVESWLRGPVVAVEVGGAGARAKVLGLVGGGAGYVSRGGDDVAADSDLVFGL